MHSELPSLVALFRDPQIDPNELVCLMWHYKHGEHGTEINELFFPNKESFAIRLVFKKGVVNNIERGDSFRQEDVEEIRQAARAHLIESPGVGIARTVRYSRPRLCGAWKYGERFQILPVPPHAPQLAYSGGDHPFLLEVRFRRSTDRFLNALREAQASLTMTTVLSALFVSSIRWDTSGDQPSWMLLETAAEPPGLRSDYLRHGYAYEGLNEPVDQFSPVS